MSTLEQRLDAPDYKVDHYAGLRAQRKEHMRNAMWWKARYRAWGGSMALNWFHAEARLHRFTSRILWRAGVN